MRTTALAVSLLALATLGFGCQPGSRESRDVIPGPSAEDAVRESNEIAFLPLSDGDCRGGAASLGQQTLWRWQNGALSRQEVDAGLLRSDEGSDGAGLRGGDVAASIYGFRQASTGQCQIDGSSVSCTENRDAKIEGGRELRLCRANSTYERNSIEAVALATALTINEAAATYRSQAPSGALLSRVVSLVLPDIHTDFVISGNPADKRRQRLADNAIWSKVPITLNGKTAPMSLVSVFPSTRTFVDGNGGGVLGLWEIPFVIAHEFGHHVFYHNAANFRRGVDAQVSALTIEGSIVNPELQRAEELRRSFERVLPHRVPFQILRGAEARRVVNSKVVMSAFNEAFADGFAHVHTKGASASLSVLPGICGNRDMASDSFRWAGLTFEKKLGRAAVDHFLSSPTADPTQPDQAGCHPVSFQDPYVVGAVLSRGFVRLTDGRPDALNVLVKWAQELDAAYANVFLSPGGLLEQGVRALANAAMTGGALTPSQCAVWAEVLPAFDSPCGR